MATVKKIVVWFLFFSVPALHASAYRICNVTIITASLPSVINRYSGFVEITDDKITNVQAGFCPEDDSTPVVDGQNEYLIPGLIDSHVAIDYMKSYLPQDFLYYGYTTVIDLFTSNPLVTTGFNGAANHPDLILSHGAVVPFQGYPVSKLSIGELMMATPNIIFSAKAAVEYGRLLQRINYTPEKIVAYMDKRHAKFIKVFYEKGWRKDKDLPVIPPSVLNKLVLLAHGKQIKVILHANSLSAYRAGLEAGVDAFSHGLWRWGKSNGKRSLPNAAKKRLDQALAKQVCIQPTFQTLKLLSPILFDQNDKIIRYFSKHKGCLLFGTDTPPEKEITIAPGLNGYLEMQDWLQAGLKLKQIFLSATLHNAHFFGLDQAYGVIAPGHVANLLLLKEDPLNTLNAYDEIDKIILHGKVLSRESLHTSTGPNTPS